MGLKIDNGVLLSPDANGNYVERAAFNNDGDLIFKNADGSSKGAGITESAGDLRYLQLSGGTVTGAFHANHTSNTFSGASVTAANLHINDTDTKLTEGAGNAVRIQTGTGYIDIGSMNSSWVHFQADRAVYMWANGGAFSFDADVVPYANNAKNLGNNSSRWATIYANGGDSSQWNTAYGWGNHSGLYLGVNAKAADSNLLDGIDSSSFFRKDVEAQDISGYVRINKNWGGGTYGAEAFTIRGTHPSFSLRSTQADYKWLFHTDASGNLRIYTGSVVDDNAWTNRFSFTTDNNFYIESGHLYVQSGNVYASGGNSTLWNTAYSWGNHASAGYLTSLPAHTHDDRYYTESEVDTLLATKSATSHTHNVYDLNNYNSGQDPNTYLQSRIWTSLTGGTVGNYPSSYTGVVNLGMTGSYGLQFSYYYGGTDDGLYFRHKSDNPGAPNGVGWQGWKTVASRQWVQAQGYLTSSGIGSYATQQYVTDSINSLINGAPGALNTLDELAAALGDDANFASTVTNSISTKVSKSGDTMTGNLTIAQSSGNNIFTINSNGGGTPVIYMYSPSRWWGQFVSNNNLTFKDETGNIEVLTLEAGGNVGVGLADPAYKLDVSGDINASAAVRAYQFQGNANVSGTGNASYHPSGIYSAGTNWLYGTMYLNANSINDTGDIRLYNSSYSFRARYNSGNDNYHASLNWYGLQLGNNGDNYIVGGRTNPGGNLRFYVNNTSDFTTINGTLSAIMHSTGRTTFGGGTDYGYTLNVAGSFYATDWIRVGGTQGLYFESYGGGWNMIDTSWIRAYNDKGIYTAGYMKAARFEDANDSAYYLDPASTSNLNAVQTTSISATSSSTATGVSFRQPYEVISGEGWALASYAYNDNDGFLWLDRDSAGGQARPVFHIGGKNNASHGGYAAEDSIITLTRTDGVKTEGNSYSYRGLSNSAYYTSIIKTTTGTVFRDAQSRYDFVGSVYAKGATSGADVLAIDGVNGRLFTVTDDLSDSLFSVNTVAGLPVMEVFADNTVKIGKYGATGIYVGSDARVGIGTSDFSYTINDNSPVVGSNTNNKLFVNGSIQLLSNNDAIVIGRGAATFLKDEELGFGWGGGWYMTESSYIRSRNGKSLHMNGGSVDYVGSIYLEGSGTYAHLQPNAGSYGTLQVTNSKSGWAGIRFTSYNTNLMSNANESGIYHNDYGWQFYWNNGTLYCYKNANGGGTQATVLDSSNFTNWAQEKENQRLSTSSAPTFAEVYTSGWFRNTATNAGLYHNTNGNHFYSRNANTWVFTSSSGAIELQLRTGHEGALRGYVYGSTSDEIGFLSGDGNWVLRTWNRGVEAYGSMRAPIFYDSQDTGYYVDPNSESKLRKLWINNGGASGVGWSSGLNMGDGSNYWNFIQDAGIARQRNYGTGGFDWYNNDASIRLMYLDNVGALSIANNITSGGYIYSNYNIRVGEIWGQAGLYRSSGHMMFGTEGGHWYFQSSNNTRAQISQSDGNIWMQWANDWLSNLLGAKVPLSGNASIGGWIQVSSSTQGTPIIKAVQQDTSTGYYLFQGMTGSSEVFRVDRNGNLVLNGAITASGYNKSNWDTAYGWGNHASANYIVRGSTQAEGAWTSATKFKSAGDIGTDTSSQHSLQIYADNGNDAFMAFHISGDYAVFFGLDDATNRLYTGGWSAGGNKYQIWDSRDFSSTNISNWNTAYGWGNHASAGYQAASTAITTSNIGSQSVSYATSAGSADQIDGRGFRNTGSNESINADSIASNGITYYTAGVSNFSGNATDGALYSQAYSTEWQHQIAGDYRSGMIAVRGKNAGTWQAWRTIIDSTTIGSQSVNYASSAGNADTTDGLHVHGGRNNEVNKIVRTDANGYIQAGWINSTSGAFSSGINKIYCSDDDYIRYQTPTNFIANLGLATIAVQDTAPAGAAGKFWWESDTGKLKIYYNSAWVDASPIPDMSIYYTKAGGAITGEVTIQQTLTVVGNVLIEGTLTETSDITLKENILPLQDSLNKVLKLNGVSFNKKTTPELKEIGFIAQEVEEVLPELVTETDEGIKTVAYSRVTAVLVETIKEQQAQIDELKQVVNKLVEKLNTL